MQPHVLEFIPEDELRLFTRVCYVVEHIPDMDFGERNLEQYRIKNAISCHMLTRALASFFPFEVKDGIVGNIWEHSWLLTKKGFIIDVYPIGIFQGPLFVDASASTPWYGFYSRVCSFTEHREPHFLAKVKKVETEVAKILKKAGWLSVRTRNRG